MLQIFHFSAGGRAGEGKGGDQGTLLGPVEKEEADPASERAEVRLRLGRRRRHRARLQPALQRETSDSGSARSSWSGIFVLAKFFLSKKKLLVQ